MTDALKTHLMERQKEGLSQQKPAASAGVTPASAAVTNGRANGHTNGRANGISFVSNGHATNGLVQKNAMVVGWDPSKMRKRMKVRVRELTTGLGVAVGRRTILRIKKNGKREKWTDVAQRVARGNTLLIDGRKKEQRREEFKKLKDYIGSGILLMSGRHLQHGDSTQPTRNMEVFTNCSTSSTSYILFYLLLNGSGVGRAYDDDMCLTNWDNMPIVRCVLDDKHRDFVWGEDESVAEARHKYNKVYWFEVPDNREGWAQAIEKLEVMAYEKKYRDDVLVLDFSKVRPKGEPIHGMQDRPASGPKPLMHAITKLATVKNAGMPQWKQAMFVDHYLAECVLVGGARRAARIGTKVWSDPEIFDFIDIKRGGFLWSANNSVAVDDKFWQQKTKHSRKVLDAVLKASYYHDTGEPGFINQHRFVQNDDKYDGYLNGRYAESSKYVPGKQTRKMLAHIARNASSKLYTQIPNPCGEISLNMLGGYCVIGDVVPYFAPNLEVAEDAFRAMTRALMRVNTMDSLYNKEVKRTNRIGVGMTGVHEFAWNAFGYTFYDLIDEEESKDFWLTLAHFKRAVVDEAQKYSKELGLSTPHTNTTIKPAGTTSKLFGVSEGAHLPAMREYIRWVQFRNDDPLVKKYKKMRYPTKVLKSYSGTTVIGFPTQPEICRLGMGSKLVTAAEATPEEQFKWLMLLEKYWIVGVDEAGQPLKDTGNQVSYTLKYKKDKVSYRAYKQMVTKYQSQVKVCSVMPQQDVTAYEYQPEQAVTIGQFMEALKEVTGEVDEDIDLDALKCEAGACPI